MDLEHEKRLTDVENLAESNARRIKEVEKKQNDLSELVVTVGKLVTREERVESDVKEMKSDIKTLVNKPAKRWEAVVEKITLTIIVAIITFLLARLGL